MGQVSLFLRKVENGYAHWCPGCEEMHAIPNCCSFDGSLSEPTFYPALKFEWVKPPPTVEVTGHASIKVKMLIAAAFQSEAEEICCHYFLTRGKLQFQNDCTHDLAGLTVALPVLPIRHRDR